MDAPDFTYADLTVTAGLTYRYRIQIQHEQSASEFSNLATFVAAGGEPLAIGHAFGRAFGGLPSQPTAVTLVSQPRAKSC